MAVEIVERTPDPSEWTSESVCVTCRTKFTFTGEDLKKAGFKANGGYWFDGSATSIDRAFINCPECDHTRTWDREDLPTWLWRQIPHSP